MTGSQPKPLRCTLRIPLISVFVCVFNVQALVEARDQCGVLSSAPLLAFLRKGLSLNLELSDSAALTGLCPSLPLALGL